MGGEKENGEGRKRMGRGEKRQAPSGREIEWR